MINGQKAATANENHKAKYKRHAPANDMRLLNFI